MAALFVKNLGDLGQARLSYAQFLFEGFSRSLAKNLPNPLHFALNEAASVEKQAPIFLTFKEAEAEEDKEEGQKEEKEEDYEEYEDKDILAIKRRIGKIEEQEKEEEQKSIALAASFYFNELKFGMPTNASYVYAQHARTYSVKLFLPYEYYYPARCFLLPADGVWTDNLKLSPYNERMKKCVRKEYIRLTKKYTDAQARAKIQDLYFFEKDILFIGEIPLMTGEGSFVINGVERVIVSQLLRCPGVYFKKRPGKAKDKQNYYGATILSSNGRWTEVLLRKHEKPHLGPYLDIPRFEPEKPEPGALFGIASYVVPEEEEEEEAISLNEGEVRVHDERIMGEEEDESKKDFSYIKTDEDEELEEEKRKKKIEKRVEKLEEKVESVEEKIKPAEEKVKPAEEKIKPVEEKIKLLKKKVKKLDPKEQKKIIAKQQKIDSTIAEYLEGITRKKRKKVKQVKKTKAEAEEARANKELLNELESIQKAREAEEAKLSLYQMLELFHVDRNYIRTKLRYPENYDAYCLVNPFSIHEMNDNVPQNMKKLEDFEKEMEILYRWGRLDVGILGRARLNQKFHSALPDKYTKLGLEDLCGIINGLLDLDHGVGTVDDLDHFKYKRVRQIGDIFQEKCNAILRVHHRTDFEAILYGESEDDEEEEEMLLRILAIAEKRDPDAPRKTLEDFIKEVALASPRLKNGHVPKPEIKKTKNQKAQEKAPAKEKPTKKGKKKKITVPELAQVLLQRAIRMNKPIQTKGKRVNEELDEDLFDMLEREELNGEMKEDLMPLTDKLEAKMNWELKSVWEKIVPPSNPAENILAFRRTILDILSLRSYPTISSLIRKLYECPMATQEFKLFFTTSEISQYFDQVNPLASLTHKRRVTVLGPQGLKRDRIANAIRDIQPSQYGRICPVETSEGKNAGVVTSLSLLSRIDQHGWIQTPYFYVNDGYVYNANSPIFLDPGKEAQARTSFESTGLTHEREISSDYLSVKEDYIFSSCKKEDIDFLIVTPLQIIAAGTGLIPFLEHNDANRVLMGSNMQRQAVPLLYTQKAIVGTGHETSILQHSAMVLKARLPGYVVRANGLIIEIVEEAFQQKMIYLLDKFRRSNQETCMNQKPLVWPGEYVEARQIIADGPSTNDGELALGRNLIVAYMPWEGYNYEDAIVISQRLVDQDCLTSIHIHTCQTRIERTENGQPEELTDTPPYTTASIRRHLVSKGDLAGIPKIGSYVLEYDLLIGKKKTEWVEKNSQEEFLTLIGTLSAPESVEEMTHATKKRSRQVQENDFQRHENEYSPDFSRKYTENVPNFYLALVHFYSEQGRRTFELSENGNEEVIPMKKKNQNEIPIEKGTKGLLKSTDFLQQIV